MACETAWGSSTRDGIKGLKSLTGRGFQRRTGWFIPIESEGTEAS